MPLFPRDALGLELTDSLFKLVEIKRGFRRIRLTQYVVHPVLPMEERSASDREEWIQSVREALNGRRFRTRHVHLALGNRQVVTGIWKLPEMREARMRRWIGRRWARCAGWWGSCSVMPIWLRRWPGRRVVR